MEIMIIDTAIKAIAVSFVAAALTVFVKFVSDRKPEAGMPVDFKNEFEPKMYFGQYPEQARDRAAKHCAISLARYEGMTLEQAHWELSFFSDVERLDVYGKLYGSVLAAELLLELRTALVARIALLMPLAA